VTTFVDTSALLAVLDADDKQHERASRTWRTLIDAGEPLLTTSYVLVETFALTQARLGLDAVGALDSSVVPLLQTIWVDDALHRAGIAALLTAHRRDLSLVDCVSFEAMRRHGITRAFVFDRHFRELGFSDVGK
jgi:predicted nucleic acid-binding protein